VFQKILIANRGEIAVRVMHACKEMGIVPVAVYSDVDRRALHVLRSYEAWPIGGAESRDSYLNTGAILEAAKRSGADAIHPGYGFLAENAEFARACERAGITFIGPPPEAIEQMGNKLSARATMKTAGVEMVPGSTGAVQSAGEASAVARKIGFPVILKAAAGGGGKGMRIVHDENELPSALERTIGEAQNAFGDGSVYVEKYIERPRHIEIQIMADADGHVSAWGERECSMQRRYQKVIEECPSPFVTPAMRSSLSAAACRAARAVHYRGAGTVEFIADPQRNFYFLEMNTRLQVEHPVTEAVYGIDLVKQQIRVAAGEPVVVAPDVPEPAGAAIELRVYAEDPANGFLPSVGRITRLALPQGPGVRNENGVYTGYDIPIYYDPMLCKIIVWAENRSEAIRRARRALREFRADGVRTNVDFLLWALCEPDFASGDYDTHYVETHFDPEKLRAREDDHDLATIAASIVAWREATTRRFTGSPDTAGESWRRCARVDALRRPLRTDGRA